MCSNLLQRSLHRNLQSPCALGLCHTYPSLGIWEWSNCVFSPFYILHVPVSSMVKSFIQPQRVLCLSDIQPTYSPLLLCFLMNKLQAAYLHTLMFCHFELESEDYSRQKYHLVPVRRLNTGEYKKRQHLESFNQFFARGVFLPQLFIIMCKISNESSFSVREALSTLIKRAFLPKLCALVIDRGQGMTISVPTTWCKNHQACPRFYGVVLSEGRFNLCHQIYDHTHTKCNKLLKTKAH